MAKGFLIGALRISHVALIVFVLFGWSIAVSPVRTFHLIFVPLVILHWFTNGGECAMTQWERHLKGKTGGAQGDFSVRLLKLIGVEMEPKALLLLIYGLMLSSWLGSLILVILT